MVLTLGALTP